MRKMTITLSDEIAKMLDLLSELQSVSQVEALRRAISTEAFLQREIKNGSKVLVKNGDQVRELVFR